MSGWIKLHRKLLEWEWFDDSQTVHLWIYILLRANHKDQKWRGISVGKGELITSRDSLCTDTGISQQSIRTILKRLENTGNITIKSTNKYTIISVCNWDNYQPATNQQLTSNQPATNQQLTSNQPATNQQLTTDKNVKNLKNVEELNKEKVKKEITRSEIHDMAVSEIQWPNYFDQDLKDLFLMFLEERRTSKKYVTKNALTGLFNKLQGFTKTEQINAINDAIAAGYQSFFPKKQLNKDEDEHIVWMPNGATL